jgi:cellobiose dehydrogenase (acceptor)
VTCALILLLLIFYLAIPGALAQSTLGTYTDPETGIVFSTSQISDTVTEGGFTWGFALPPDAETVDSTEYIGIIVRLL